jgi:hypothetical protein
VAPTLLLLLLMVFWLWRVLAIKRASSFSTVSSSTKQSDVELLIEKSGFD